MDAGKYESLISRLRKLSELASKGYGGEAENAHKILIKLCAEYGIKPEQIFDEKEELRFITIGTREIDKMLFVQCYCKVMNTDEVKYYKTGKKSQIAVNLTNCQYAELISLLKWHKANLNSEIDKMMKTLFESYCYKHRLLNESDDNREKEDKPLTEEERKKIKAILSMMDNLNDKTYHKLIEAKL